MKIFEAMYARTMKWAAHPKAPYYLGGLSFAESSFFPIPPDVMLMPMSLAKPDQWWRLALITTVASVLGGILGYLIGVWGYEAIEPWIIEAGYGEKMELAKAWFDQWGVWVVFVAGFSPIPYKIFTITGGAMSMAILPFIIASAVGRGARFFLVAGLVAWAGPKMEPTIRRYIEWIGWATVALLVIVIIWYQGTH